MKWNNGYDDKLREAAKAHSRIECLDESLTQQQFREDADLNVLAKRFGLTDVELIPVPPVDPSHYGDVSGIGDLRTLLERQRDGLKAFMQLDPKVRSRFRNDPGQLWEWVNNPENFDEAVKMGLLSRREPDPPSSGGNPPPAPPAPPAAS